MGYPSASSYARREAMENDWPRATSLQLRLGSKARARGIEGRLYG